MKQIGVFENINSMIVIVTFTSIMFAITTAIHAENFVDHNATFKPITS